MNLERRATTGFPGLDRVLDDLRIGDNVVWRMDSVADYAYFVTPFIRTSLERGRKVVYMRFGRHKALVEESSAVTVHQLDAYRGFEPFASRVHQILTDTGPQAFYVFDCLTDLLLAWATDAMIGNFFQVTCPYLFELDTIAYFGLLRSGHSFQTIAQIRNTTQLLLDIYTCNGRNYVHPMKVWERRSPTMFLPHLEQDTQFIPIANSDEATCLTRIYMGSADQSRRQLDYWDRLFLEAERLMREPAAEEQRRGMAEQLCRMLIGHDERMLELARRYLHLEDLLNIKARTIGTGYIGGKAVGMLLARNILLQDLDFDWQQYLEPHDSFHVASDIYFSYIVHNGWWKLLMRQQTPEGYFVHADELREKLSRGSFPTPVRIQFQEMLEHFGQYPIIVRSSSLLEDGFGNAFAGKYDSFFCVNQGSPEDRYQQFEEAVRQIFASTMSPDALAYRRQRGLDRYQEQMALLVQRVSGAYHEQYYFPELAGVGISHNTFVWNRELDPRAGMLRLVFGLGTRAVDRVENDYPRIVALDNPLQQPLHGFDDLRRFSQRDVDLLDVSSNELTTLPFNQLSRYCDNLELERYAVPDRMLGQEELERSRGASIPRLLTFEKLFRETRFSELMQRMLKTLEATYRYPVDVEFTASFYGGTTPRINLLQCRPLQTRGAQQAVKLPKNLARKRIFFRSTGNFMGGNLIQSVSSLIWIESSAYNALSQGDKYEVARLVGRLNREFCHRQDNPTLLMGPGRWGTTTPSLGVPVRFAEINNVTALAEVAFASGGLMPELSFGSHFFQDLVETEIFYLALFPENPGCLLNPEFLAGQPNQLMEQLPDSRRFAEAIRVISWRKPLRLMADVVAQQLVCFR